MSDCTHCKELETKLAEAVKQTIVMTDVAGQKAVALTAIETRLAEAEARLRLYGDPEDDKLIARLEAAEAKLAEAEKDRDYLNETNNRLLDLTNECQNQIAALEAKLAAGGKKP